MSQYCILNFVFFFFQAEDGIRDLVRSRGLGDVYKRQPIVVTAPTSTAKDKAIIKATISEAVAKVEKEEGLSLIHI